LIGGELVRALMAVVPEVTATVVGVATVVAGDEVGVLGACTVDAIVVAVGGDLVDPSHPTATKRATSSATVLCRTRQCCHGEQRRGRVTNGQGRIVRSSFVTVR
jgi:hypothetical protein